jgi:hypothetical protein
MAQHECPNISNCTLVANPAHRLPDVVVSDYVHHYCRSMEGISRCKRYQVKLELGFCPDFVLPDTPESIAEIIAKFDETEEE